IQPQSRLGNVSLQNFDAFRQPAAQVVSMPLVERFKCGRLGHDALKPLQRRTRPLAANQQINATDLWQVFEQHRQPDLADESRRSNNEQVLSGQSLANRESFNPMRRLTAKIDNRVLWDRMLPSR